MAWALAGAASVILVVGLLTWSHYERRQQMLTQALPIPEFVDLSNVVTYRGQQPGKLKSVLLPAARIHLTIILPRFSQPGQYLIAVTHDQNGNDVVAEGAAGSSASGTREKVTVYLDLRAARAGKYFLSTTHEQDQASYYYPLKIR